MNIQTLEKEPGYFKVKKSIKEKLKFIFIRVTYVFIFSFLLSCNEAQKQYPTGVEFQMETITRKGYFGDNWCQTWASDNNIYTMLDDGNGWWGNKEKREELDDWEGSMCIQISGDAGFTADDVKKMTGWPGTQVTSPLYAYGTVAVDGTLYVWLWKSEKDTWYQRPIANRLLYSPDLGKTFFRWDGQKETEETINELDKTSFFFYKEDPKWKTDRDAYAFNWIAFCQNGKDNSAAKDDYIYMYAPEQYDPRNLSVIRVNKEHILNRSEYEYFAGWDGETPKWTKNIKDRDANLRYPENRSDGEWLWASWFPSVVYNQGLDLYIMVSYGISDSGKSFWSGWCSNCSYPASLGFWYSENPWGPWTQFHYTEYFYADRPQNRTYGFKLSPKWISDDGKTMQLIWSDAGDNHTTNYKWNQMEINILTD